MGVDKKESGLLIEGLLLRKKEFRVRAPSWGTEGRKRALVARERRSRAGRLQVVVYSWRFRKQCLASGSGWLWGGPLKVRGQALVPAALWHTFLLLGSLPCLPCRMDWNLPKLLHNINTFSLPLFLPGILFIATTQKWLTQCLDQWTLRIFGLDWRCWPFRGQCLGDLSWSEEVRLISGLAILPWVLWIWRVSC